MPPKQKILAIKLCEKISKKPAYAESIGIKIQKNTKKERSD